MANDVAVALGYKDPAMAIQRHVKSSQKTTGILPAVNGKQIWAINGGGLYSILPKRCITQEALWLIRLLDFTGLAQKDAAEHN